MEEAVNSKKHKVDVQPADMVPAAASDQASWSEFNEKQRMTVLKFVTSLPLPRMLAVLPILHNLVNLQRRMSALTSNKRETEQRQRVARGQARTSRLHEVGSQSLTNQFFTSASLMLLDNTALWNHVFEADRTEDLANMVFAMISIAICGVGSQIHAKHRQFPFRLWKILFDPDFHLELEGTRQCMFDYFTRALIKYFKANGGLSLSVGSVLVG